MAPRLWTDGPTRHLKDGGCFDRPAVGLCFLDALLLASHIGLVYVDPQLLQFAPPDGRESDDAHVCILPVAVAGPRLQLPHLVEIFDRLILDLALYKRVFDDPLLEC